MKYIYLNCKSDYDALNSAARLDYLIDRASNLGCTAIGVNGGSSFKGAIHFYRKAIEKGIKPIISIEKKILGIDFLLIPKDIGSYSFLIKEKNEENILNNKEVIKIAFPNNISQMDILSNYNTFYGLDQRHEDQSVLYKGYKDIEIVVAPKVLYITKEDKDLYRAVKAIKTKKKIEEISIKDDYHFMSSIEMDKIFGKYKEGIDNISKISSQINLTFNKLENYKFDNDNNILKDLVAKQLNITFKNDAKAFSRANKELEVIEKKKLSSYFLLVKDIVSIAESMDILVGLGRGSATSSFVSYLLGITKVNPLTYNLLFERFLNMERETLPDIDLDVEHDKRDILINKIREKYPSLSSISVYSKFTKKSSYTILSQITKDYKQIDALSIKMDGLIYNRGLHPAGISIVYSPILEVNNGLCEYDMHELEFLGVNKIDILSLRTLTLLKSALNLTELTLSDIPLDNKETYLSLTKGSVDNVFQLESDSAKNILKVVKPKNIEDLAIVLALNRPGPLERGFITKGLINRENMSFIYQESLMIELNKKGYAMDESANLIRAISKKDNKKIEQLKEELSKKDIAISKILDKFGSYCFPKSHAIAYAMISYFIAYIKVNYTNEFEVALIDNGYKKAVNTVMPDINFSDSGAKIINNRIIYGLNRVKGLDKIAINSIVRERKVNGIFSSIQNLKNRTGIRDESVKILRSMGALSSIKTQMNRLFGEEAAKYTICLKIDALSQENNITLKNLIISNPGSIPLLVINKDKSFLLTKRVSFNEKFVSETQRILGCDKVFIKP